MLKIFLKDNRTCFLRTLTNLDANKLFEYFSRLSDDTKKRFGPHSFDIDTVNNICNNLESDNTKRFVALDDKQEKIIAYALVKFGLIEEDEHRYLAYGTSLNHKLDITYAPSVADAYQSSGLGSKIFAYILEKLSTFDKRYMVLWGGVQASNIRAVNYYLKHDFIKIAEFTNHHGLNFDMYKKL